MTRTFRRIIFYSLVFLFVVVTPPTILYATGYSFDWTNKQLTQTGGLYLKSAPDQAVIFIDDKKQKTTPRLISHLKPKTYAVAITKDGFYPWRKNLEVAASLVTEARNIILFPQKIEPVKIIDNATSTIEKYLESTRATPTPAPQITVRAVGQTIKDSDIFYISAENFILYRQDLSGFVKEQLSKEGLPKASYDILVSNNGRILALSGSENLYLLNKDSGVFELTSAGVKEAAFSSDNKKILIRSANELWIFYLEDILIQPYKKMGDKELLTRYAQPINQAVFYPNNEYVALVIGDQIKIIELDGRDTRNIVDFISAPKPQVYFDEPNSYFYYLTAGQIWRIKLEM